MRISREYKENEGIRNGHFILYDIDGIKTTFITFRESQLNITKQRDVLKRHSLAFFFVSFVMFLLLRLLILASLNLVISTGISVRHVAVE